MCECNNKATSSHQYILVYTAFGNHAVHFHIILLVDFLPPIYVHQVGWVPFVWRISQNCCVTQLCICEVRQICRAVYVNTHQCQSILECSFPTSGCYTAYWVDRYVYRMADSWHQLTSDLQPWGWDIDTWSFLFLLCVIHVFDIVSKGFWVILFHFAPLYT